MTLGDISMRGKQPPRKPGEHSLRITVMGDELCIATVSGDEKQETTGYIMVSEYNAWSLIGSLSLFVGLKLPDRIGKRIKL